MRLGQYDLQQIINKITEDTVMEKKYKLGNSDYEFVSLSGTYTEFKTDKEGKIIRRLNNENILKVVSKDKPTTVQFVTELFSNPNMYLKDTAPEVGRSLTVMETIGEDVVFRGFVACKDYSIRLTMDQHAKDVLASAKEGISLNLATI